MFAWRVLAAALLAACAAGPGTSRVPPLGGHADELLGRFLADEERALGMLAAADPRMAARGVVVDAATMHHTAMAGILVEDPTLGVEPGKDPAGRPDVFSFGVRNRALDAAAAVVGRWKAAPSDPDLTSTRRPELELELLLRLLAGERLRLAAERELPRSASVLFEGLTATWQPPDEVTPRDEWLDRRLTEVDHLLTPGTLTLLERDELDDSLDGVERLAGEAFFRSRQALTRLRISIQNVQTAAAANRWESVATRLRAVDGRELSPETLLGYLRAEADHLRTEMHQLVVEVTEEVATKAADTWDTTARCTAPATTSRLRQLQPPSERAFDCGLRARVLAAHTAEEDLIVLVGMHDAVVAAAWSVVLAQGGATSTLSLAAPHPVWPMSPTLEGRLTRFAATHPVEAISRAFSIEWIMRNGLAEAALRAQAWTAFGDAPLDIIERELHPDRRSSQLTAKTPGWRP